MPISQFRTAVYQTFPCRADAALDLIEALTSSSHIHLPVGLSEAGLFRRKFSITYDVLEHSQWNLERLNHLLAEAQPGDAHRITGYAVYAVDATENSRPEAQILPDREVLKANQFNALYFGHKYA